MKIEIPTIGRVVLISWGHGDSAALPPVPCLVQSRFNLDTTPVAIMVYIPMEGGKVLLRAAQHRSQWTVECGFNYSWEWPPRSEPIFVDIPE